MKSKEFEVSFPTFILYILSKLTKVKQTCSHRIKFAYLMWCLRHFSWQLWRRGGLTRETIILPQNRRGIWRIRPRRMISFKPQHILARTHRRALTCRGRKRTKISPKKLRLQQPIISLISSFFNRRSLLNQLKSVQS